MRSIGCICRNVEELWGNYDREGMLLESANIMK